MSEVKASRLFLRGRPIVNREGHLIAIEIDLEHAVNRLTDGGELVERGAEKLLLHRATDGRYQNDEAGMQRLRRIELPEIARVVGDKDKIIVAGVAHDIPVLPARAANMRDMPCFMAALLGDGDQADAEALVDQKPHDTAIVSSRLRPRRTGC
jgi:hypothetical protein